MIASKRRLSTAPIPLPLPQKKILSLMAITVDVNNGPITASGLSAPGGIQLKSDNGDIEIQQTNGPLTIHGLNGGIKLQNATGDAELSTKNGAVSVAP